MNLDKSLHMSMECIAIACVGVSGARTSAVGARLSKKGFELGFVLIKNCFSNR